MFFLSGFVFGWAKPVPVNWANLKNKKRDMALVALAGPAANLIMILFWLGLIKLFLDSAEQGNVVAHIIVLMSWAGIVINSLIMIFNLLPMPPLGWKPSGFFIITRQVSLAICQTGTLWIAYPGRLISQWFAWKIYRTSISYF